jgi:hypothetical protein
MCNARAFRGASRRQIFGDEVVIDRSRGCRYNDCNIPGGITSLCTGKERIVAVSMRAVPALAVVLLASAFVIADETPSKTERKPTDPAASTAKPQKSAEAKAVRLTKPWKDLTSLSDDQKRQISQIHRKAVDEVKAVEQREKADIMALLSDQQKAELTALQEKEAAERKAKAGQKSGKAESPGAARDEAKSSQEADADSN